MLKDVATNLEYTDKRNRTMETPLALEDGMTDVTGATGAGVSLE